MKILADSMYTYYKETDVMQTIPFKDIFFLDFFPFFILFLYPFSHMHEKHHIQYSPEARTVLNSFYIVLVFTVKKYSGIHCSTIFWNTVLVYSGKLHHRSSQLYPRRMHVLSLTTLTEHSGKLNHRSSIHAYVV